MVSGPWLRSGFGVCDRIISIIFHPTFFINFLLYVCTVSVLFSSLGRYRYSTKENGRRTDLGGDQSRLKLFTYVHGVPGVENMGGNIPTYFLVQSRDNISRQTSIQEEHASKWVNNPLSPNQIYSVDRFIRVAQRKERYSRPSATTSIFTNFFFPNPTLIIFHLHTSFTLT